MSRKRTSEATTRWLCAPDDESWMRWRMTVRGTPSTVERRPTTSALSATSASATIVIDVRLPTSTVPSASQMRPRGAGVDTVVYAFASASRSYSLAFRTCMPNAFATSAATTVAAAAPMNMKRDLRFEAGLAPAFWPAWTERDAASRSAVLSEDDTPTDPTSRMVRPCDRVRSGRLLTTL